MQGSNDSEAKQFRTLLAEARRHILSAPITSGSHKNLDLASILDAHLVPVRPKNPADIYRRILESASNRQHMPNVIGDIGRLKPILYNLDPHKVAKNHGTDWRSVFLRIKNQLGLPARISPANERGTWVQFSKTVVSAAQFLLRHPSDLDLLKEFEKFQNAVLRDALPCLLSHEIHGFGFPLACDFLKELGFDQYAKPDVHVKDILSGLGFCDPQNDLEVGRTVFRVAKANSCTPYAADKLLWLVGSGSLYRNGVHLQTNKHAFIESLKSLFFTGR